MTDKYSVTVCTPHDLELVAADMRDMDVFECRAAGFKTPLDALHVGLLMGKQTWTFNSDGEPLCVFGDVPDNSGGAVFWLLGTNKVRQHKRAFMRYSKMYKELYLAKYTYLTNVVCMDNDESVRWLKWLGAKFIDGVAMIDGKPFQRFYIERGDG